MVIRRRRAYGRSYANRQRYRRRRGRYGRRRFPKKYRTRLYLGAGKKYARRSKYAGGISKLLRRRGRSRKIFKTGDLAKYKGVQTWASVRESGLKQGEAPADENASIFYNTTLTSMKIMMRLLWKEAKFVYLYRNRVRLLPKIYELASAGRGRLQTGTDTTRTVENQDGSRMTLSNKIRLNENTVPNENWKELKMMVKLIRTMNPQNDEWSRVVENQKSALQLATIFTLGNLGIQRMDNFLRAVYPGTYPKVAGNILLALITVTKQVADEYNIIPIISINY